jgi:hypothetical protein
MHPWRLSLLLLALSAGCKDKTEQQDPAIAQALAQAASAQAIASAIAAQAQPGGPAKPQSLNDTVSEALAQAASAQAMASAAAVEGQTKVAGNVHFEGGPLGTTDTALGACQSGEVNGFFGVDFYVAGSTDTRLRYVHDEAAGDVVKVAVPGKSELAVFGRSAKCSVLEGSLEKTNFNTWTPKGNIRHLNGHVKFDCPTGGGKARVSGEATFSHCH